MPLSIKPLHPTFGGEVGPIDLKAAGAAELAEIRAGMDRFAVLVFHDQDFDDEQQVAFARRLDGELHTRTASNALKAGRGQAPGGPATQIANVDAEGRMLEADNRRRLENLANRMWHTDASFAEPAGRYSLLFARVVPPVASDTQFADMRAAYDALPAKRQTALEGLVAHHSIAYSRSTLGFEFSEAERQALPSADHPLVRRLPGGRKGLYLASHVGAIQGWPVPEARILMRELIEHATQPRFVFNHAWRAGDLVIWDNRATMHRATAFDDRAHVRDMRRVTTLDLQPTG